MTKPKAETQPLAHRLSRYVDLEADAVDEYALAACRLSDLDALPTVGDFRAQHEAQRDEVARLRGEAGGGAFDPFRPRRPSTDGWARLASCPDDESMFAVLRDAEWSRMNEYEAGMRAPEADAGVRNALERGYFGCLTRLRWLERRALQPPKSGVAVVAAGHARPGASRWAR